MSIFQKTDYVDLSGIKVEVIQSFNGVWISVRGNHRVKSSALPPRKTRNEAQRDLDAYAFKNGWLPAPPKQELP
jgi:hypothetical protein